MEIITGKCHCGDNSYSIKAEPEFQFICYCNGCRTLNAGGHLCGMMLDEASFSKATNTQKYSYPGGSGSPIDLHFCPNCATHLYAFPTAYPNKVVVRVNTLEKWNFEPQQQLFKE